MGDIATFIDINMPLMGYTYLSSDPTTIKQVLSNGTDFVRDQNFQNGSEGIAKYALFMLPTHTPGHEMLWKKHRKLLQPAFGPYHLKALVEITSNVCNSLFSSLKKTDLKNINLHKAFHAISMDVIGLSAFSYDFTLTKNYHDQTHKCFSTLDDFTNIGIAMERRFAPKILWKSLGCATAQIQSSIDGIKVNIGNVIQEKKKNIMKLSREELESDIWQKDVLDRLMQDSTSIQFKNHDNLKGVESLFTDEELKDEVTFY